MRYSEPVEQPILQFWMLPETDEFLGPHASHSEADNVVLGFNQLGARQRIQALVTFYRDRVALFGRCEHRGATEMRRNGRLAGNVDLLSTGRVVRKQDRVTAFIWIEHPARGVEAASRGETTRCGSIASFSVWQGHGACRATRGQTKFEKYILTMQCDVCV